MLVHCGMRLCVGYLSCPRCVVGLARCVHEHRVILETYFGFAFRVWSCGNNAACCDVCFGCCTLLQKQMGGGQSYKLERKGYSLSLSLLVCVATGDRPRELRVESVH